MKPLDPVALDMKAVADLGLVFYIPFLPRLGFTHPEMLYSQRVLTNTGGRWIGSPYGLTYGRGVGAPALTSPSTLATVSKSYPRIAGGSLIACVVPRDLTTDQGYLTFGISTDVSRFCLSLGVDIASGCFFANVTSNYTGAVGGAAIGTTPAVVGEPVDLAAVVDDAGNLSLYVNGALEATKPHGLSLNNNWAPAFRLGTGYPVIGTSAVSGSADYIYVAGSGKVFSQSELVAFHESPYQVLRPAHVRPRRRTKTGGSGTTIALDKAVITVSGKTAYASQSVPLDKASVVVSGKTLTATSDTIVSITKATIGVSGKALNAALSVPLTKAVVTVSGKTTFASLSIAVAKAVIGVVGLGFTYTGEAAPTTPSYLPSLTRLRARLGLSAR